MKSGWTLNHEVVRQFDTDETLYRGIEDYLAVFEACYCHCAQEIVCETVAKEVKARLNNGRDRLDRAKVDKGVFIKINGSRLCESDRFVKKSSNKFLRQYRPPLVQKSKYNESRVIDRLNRLVSVFEWNQTW